MIILIEISVILFMVLNTVYFKKVINYLNVFQFLWGGVSVLSSFGLYDLYVPSDNAYLCVLIVMISVQIFSIVFLKLPLTNRKKKIHVAEGYILNWKTIDILSLICTVGLMPFFLENLTTVMQFGFSAIREKVLIEKTYSIFEAIFLSDFIEPLFLAISIIGLYEMIENRKIRLALIFSLADCFLYMVIMGGRWVLLEFILLVVIMLFNKYKTNSINLIKNNKLVIIILVVILIAIGKVTSDRSVGEGGGIIYNSYVYFIGSINLFGVYMRNPKQYLIGTGNLLYGTDFFGGLLEPFYWVLKIIGFHVETGVNTINEITQNFVSVSPSVSMNNNVTMIYGFLRDWGYFGLIVGAFFLSVIYAYFYKSNKKYPNSMYYKGLYIYGISILPFLLFEWMPARMTIVMIPIFLKVLTSRYFKLYNNILLRRGEVK